MADSIANANAGMDALKRGDNATAIVLFTQAITPGDLSREDQESAYFERGQAYLNSGQFELAVGDFRAALKLKPDDDGAMNGLEQAVKAKTEAEHAQLLAEQQPPPAPEPAAPPPLGAADFEGVWQLNFCGSGTGDVIISTPAAGAADVSGAIQTSPMDTYQFKSAKIDGLDIDIRAVDLFIAFHLKGKLISPTRLISTDKRCAWYADKH